MHSNRAEVMNNAQVILSMHKIEAHMWRGDDTSFVEQQQQQQRMAVIKNERERARTRSHNS